MATYAVADMEMIEKLLSLLPNRLLVWLSKWAERRAIRKLGGIPIAWVIYKPWQDVPNVYIHLHPECHDEYINATMKEMAEHIRENYGDKWGRDDKDE